MGQEIKLKFVVKYQVKSSKICGRQSLETFTSILEYLDPDS